MSHRPLELTSPRAARRPISPSTEHKLGTSLSTQDLSRLAEDWLMDGEFRLHSRNTVATRRVFIKNLLWFLEKQQCASCGERELRQFFAYLSKGHEEPGGRFGNPQMKKPLRPISVKDYFVNFYSLFK